MENEYYRKEDVIAAFSKEFGITSKRAAIAIECVCKSIPTANVNVDEMVEAVDEAIRVLNAINSRGNETFDYGDYCDLYNAISAIYPTQRFNCGADMKGRPEE